MRELLPIMSMFLHLKKMLMWSKPWLTPPMTKVEMRAILAQMAQDMSTQAQVVTVQAQDMTAQANQDIAPHPH